MATFLASHIPGEIGTYEELIVWALLALKGANPGVATYQGTDADGNNYSEISMAQSFLDVQPGDLPVFASKIILRADRGWQDGSKKPWKCIIPLSANAVPEGFRAR